MFVLGKDYSRKDIYKIIKIPISTKGGNWDTGYTLYKNDFFLFCNVGIPGRTGHSHTDIFEGDALRWNAKSNTRVDQPMIQKLLNPPGYVFIFFRTEQRSKFTYAGTGIPIDYKNTSPVQITWQISSENYEIQETKIENDKIFEGALKQTVVNIYERNPLARKICLEFHGVKCSICSFDFEYTYGDLGKNYIHVHHLIPLSEIKENYEIDPLKDLVPVCPNCHAMIHRVKPAIAIKEIRGKINRGNTKKETRND